MAAAKNAAEESSTQPVVKKSRQVLVEEAELHLLIQQANIVNTAMQTMGTIINGMAARLKERRG